MDKVRKAAEHLAALDLRPGATIADIRRAHRDLIRVWHPDRFGGDERLQSMASDRTKSINAAYQWLVDHEWILDSLKSSRHPPSGTRNTESREPFSTGGHEPPPKGENSRRTRPGASENWTPDPGIQLNGPLLAGGLLIVLLLIIEPFLVVGISAGDAGSGGDASPQPTPESGASSDSEDDQQTGESSPTLHREDQQANPQGSLDTTPNLPKTVESSPHSNAFQSENGRVEDQRNLAVGEALYKKAMTERDPDQATVLFEQACSEGHGESCFLAADNYRRGWGVKRDPSRVNDLLAKGCSQGFEKACESLCLHGFSSACPDQQRSLTTPTTGESVRPPEELSIFEKAMKESDASAATTLFEQACSEGHGESCFLAADNYRRGWGVKRDPSRVNDLLAKGCSRGFEKACESTNSTKADQD